MGEDHSDLSLPAEGHENPAAGRRSRGRRSGWWQIVKESRQRRIDGDPQNQLLAHLLFKYKGICFFHFDPELPDATLCQTNRAAIVPFPGQPQDCTDVI